MVVGNGLCVVIALMIAVLVNLGPEAREVDMATAKRVLGGEEAVDVTAG